VRRLPDGTIDFVGRVDQQIKLRGFRIELGEIEAAIGAHPLVDEVCVAVVEHQQKRLAAYVVVADKELPGDLFDFVSEKLPSYMVPAVFVKMESLPLMPSGKVDRQALAEMPLPEQGVLVGADRTVVRNRVPPRSPLEQEIMDLWTEILEIPTTRLSAVEYNRVEYNRTTPLSTTKDPPPIGIYDNFFELGGHSLLATQVVSRLREDYQVELPLRQLFEKPTIAGIASLIAQSLVEEETEEDLDALLADLEHMSEDEVRQSLQMSAVEYNRTTGLSTTNFNPNGSDNVPEGQQE
jgi:acyl carrier protein